MNNTDTKAVNPRLHKGSSGTYEIRWSEDGRSKRKSTGTQDLGQATLRLADFIHSRSEERRSKERPTVKDVVSMYIREHVEPQIKSAPSHDRQVDCAAALSNGLGHIEVSALSQQDINTYRVERSIGRHGSRKAGDSTVRRELGVLVAALNHAKRARIVQEVPHVR